MKKFFIAALIALTLVSSAFASGSEKAAAHLQANYASAENITWNYGKTFQKASITVGKEKVDVYYDEYGSLIGSTKTMDFDKLPKAALETLTTEYTFPDYQLTGCIAFTDADYNTNYFVSFDMGEEKLRLSISNTGKVAPME